ncbi:MAG TPA: type II toxin-antitoxin system death-on-curing family toxin [Verrucomicrobiae bacterium]
MNPFPDNCFHLTVEILKEIHASVLEAHGGMGGIREPGLLASAIATPQASFGGKSPYTDLEEVAAAYLYYICKNHPFLDGNKRAAMAAAIVFLRLNEVEPAPDSDEWETLVLDVAASRIDRDETTRRLRLLVPQPKAKSKSPKRKP